MDYISKFMIVYLHYASYKREQRSPAEQIMSSMEQIQNAKEHANSSAENISLLHKQPWNSAQTFWTWHGNFEIRENSRK